MPDETRKRILPAIPRIIRSTRYSLTARGRSLSPSMRRPTGRSFFEKAIGRMRVPAPAAGMMPHIGRTSVATAASGIASSSAARRSAVCSARVRSRAAPASRGDVIRAALAHCLGMPLDLVQRIGIDPASVSVVERGADGPRVLRPNHVDDGSE